MNDTRPANAVDLSPEEVIHAVVGRIHTAFRPALTGMTVDEIENNAQWVIAGFPWWKTEGTDLGFGPSEGEK